MFPFTGPFCSSRTRVVPPAWLMSYATLVAFAAAPQMANASYSPLALNCGMNWALEPSADIVLYLGASPRNLPCTALPEPAAVTHAPPAAVSVYQAAGGEAKGCHGASTTKSGFSGSDPAREYISTSSISHPSYSFAVASE